MCLNRGCSEPGLRRCPDAKSLAEVVETIQKASSPLQSPKPADPPKMSSDHLQTDAAEPAKRSDYLQPDEPDGIGPEHMMPEPHPDLEPELEPEIEIEPAPAPEPEVDQPRAAKEGKLKLHSDTVDRIKVMCTELRKEHESSAGGGGASTGGKQKQRPKGKGNAKKQNVQTPFKLTVSPSSNKRW
jgi:hypothetical protein